MEARDESPVTIETERLILRMPPSSDAPLVVRYFIENREHLARWDPPRPRAFLTEPYWVERLAADRREFTEDRSMRLMLVSKETGAIIGNGNFTAFERGPFQNCRLGYTLDGRLEGRGLMTEALRAAIRFAFADLGFHRIEANHLPANERSGRLLERLGFRPVGHAPDYLFIDGAWRDHVLTALVDPDPRPPRIDG